MAAPPPSAPVPLIAARLRLAGCVFAEDEAQLLITAAGSPAELAVMVDRRAAGEPLEHVLGWAEFCGLRIAVGPGVFVPRRRTEFLARQATILARQATILARQAASPAAGSARPGTVIADLCCGSGAVAAALAAALGQVELHAADIDPAAVKYARRNLAPAGGQVYQGDLFEALPPALAGRISILIANVPYVPTGELGLLPPEARLHEPRVALDGGADGLDIMRRVAAAAPRWLAPGGHLLVEASEGQAPQAAGVIAQAGLIPRVARSARLNATVVTGTARQPTPGRGQRGTGG